MGEGSQAAEEARFGNDNLCRQSDEKLLILQDLAGIPAQR